MVRLVRVVAAAAAVAACGGGGSGGGAAPAPTEATTTTTAPPAAIDIRRPIPAGSLHGTPRPPLENTGDDYVAILESLVTNFRWLTENPDPALISELYVPGTADFEGQQSVVQELERRGWRAADEGFHLPTVEILRSDEMVATLRVVDSMSFEQIVDRNGNRVGQGRVRTPEQQAWIVTLSTDHSGRWRIADWSPANAGTVEL